VIMPSTDRGPTLLALARASIAQALGLPPAEGDLPPWLQEPGACFVTLTQKGQLRGCIGSLAAHRPLGDDVRSNAVAAALRDPRFPALTAAEFGRTQVEVSVLSPMQPLFFNSEAEALAQLRPHIDGVVLEYGAHRGTFLPQVWEQLPNPGEFMAQLKRKAKLPVDFWADGVRLQRYTVDKWQEDGPAP
jgi:AmmeMemoRadiSam system protein A